MFVAHSNTQGSRKIDICFTLWNSISSVPNVPLEWLAEEGRKLAAMLVKSG